MLGRVRQDAGADNCPNSQACQSNSRRNPTAGERTPSDPCNDPATLHDCVQPPGFNKRVTDLFYEKCYVQRE